MSETWPPSKEDLIEQPNGLRGCDLETPTLHAAIVAARKELYVVEGKRGPSTGTSGMNVHNQDPYLYQRLDEWDSLSFEASMGTSWREDDLRMAK